MHSSYKKKNSSTLYWTIWAHNRNQYFRQCTDTYPVVRIILVEFALNNTQQWPVFEHNGIYRCTAVWIIL